MGRLTSKVALITGAASGIGRASALRFAAEGAQVVAVDWDRSGGEATVNSIQQQGGAAHFFHADVSRPEDAAGMVEEAMRHCGALHVLFNNAGIFGRPHLLHEMPVEDWDHVIAVNLRGVFLGLKYGIPALLGSGGGSIINTASDAGLVGLPRGSAYSASKGGVIQLTKTAALEYAKQGIRINALAPGWVASAMVDDYAAQTGGERAFQRMRSFEPMGRLGSPEEIAAAALFLASDESSFVTGAVLIADGGMVAQ